MQRDTTHSDMGIPISVGVVPRAREVGAAGTDAALEATAAAGGSPAHQTTDERGSFSVWQDGVKVAGGSGPWEAIKREAQHYAAVYRQDGPVKVTIRRLAPERTKA